MKREVPTWPLPVLRRAEAVRLLGPVDAEAEAKAWPNKGLQPTPASLRSCLAPAFRRG